MSGAHTSEIPLPHDSRCPSCGSELERVHRDILDRWVSLFRSVHRYRCSDPACGWEGILGREDHAEQNGGPRWRLRLLWFLVGAASALAAQQAIRFYQQSQAKAASVPVIRGGADMQSRVVPPGADFNGEPLPASDGRVVRNPSPLSLRQSCSWGVPGGNPYRGTVHQALAAARLPPEVVRQVSEMAERGWVQGQVEISSAGIRTVDGRRYFGKNMLSMGFGNTLCFDTRVNFKAGHVEYPSLYEVQDQTGKTYSVMVPYVCGNVAVLG